MSRRRTPDDRLRVRVDLPPDVVARAEDIAARTGADREAVLGDLAAAALPDFLAELADDLVGQAAKDRLETGVPPALTEGTRTSMMTDESHADPDSIPGDRPQELTTDVPST